MRLISDVAGSRFKVATAPEVPVTAFRGVTCQQGAPPLARVAQHCPEEQEQEQGPRIQVPVAEPEMLTVQQEDEIREVHSP